jgi:hypothetical protein
VELAYRMEEVAPTETRLEEDGEGGCALTFKLMPRWLTVLPVITAFAAAGMYLLTSAYVIWTFWTSPFLRTVIGVGTWKPFAAFLIPGLFWVGMAVLILRSYRLHGRVARSLVVHVGNGTLSSRGEASPRWRSWRLEAVESVRVAGVKSVLPVKAGAEVVVSMRGKMFPLRVRFASRDVAVAERFAETLRRAVEGCSAKGRA